MSTRFTRLRNREALSWLGTPYLLGGSTRDGIDCSSFVRENLNSLGLAIPLSNVQMLQDSGLFIPAVPAHINRFPCYLFWEYKSYSTPAGKLPFYVDSRHDGVEPATKFFTSEESMWEHIDSLDNPVKDSVRLRNLGTRISGIREELYGSATVLSDHEDVQFSSGSINLNEVRAAHHVAIVLDRRRIIHSSITSRANGVQIDNFSLDHGASAGFTNEYFAEMMELVGYPIGLVTGAVLDVSEFWLASTIYADTNNNGVLDSDEDFITIGLSDPGNNTKVSSSVHLRRLVM
jgi:hypothetical protein